ncbi:MAG: hypothetical protein HYU31_04035, partial [Deltaproteobacteria bacterium]|nr:hypothetical protein [Deltaproteobacteria bacterium]
MAGKRSSKKSRSQAKVKTGPAEGSSWTYFKTATTALILSVYGALIAHPINLTVGDLGRHLKNGELLVRNGLIVDANLFSYTHPDHPFIALSPEKRIAEIDACCSALWARICAERAAIFNA